MKGVNYYIFTGGPNPPGAGSTTDLYDYDASISASGEVRPLYAAQQAFGRFVHDHPDWLAARRLSDFRLGLDFEYQRARQYWREPGPFLLNAPDAAAFLRQGLLTTALCASLSPELVDLDRDDWVADLSTPLVIASAASMGRAKQERLAEFLKRGGRLLIAPVLPTLDENLQPCTVLADFLGSPLQRPNRRGLSRPRIGEVVNVSGTAYPFTRVPPGAEVIGIDEFAGQPLALTILTEGGGQALLLGLQWVQSMREHERMFRGLLQRLGIVQAIHCSNPNLWATAFQSNTALYVFLLNLFTAPMQAEVQVNLSGTTIDFGSLTVEPVSVMPLVKGEG
jgi:beta-galactosidase